MKPIDRAVTLPGGRMSALDKVLLAAGAAPVQLAGEDAAGELVLAAESALTELRALLLAGWDPDHDGDDDSTAKGDTDHDYWDKDGKQLKSVPGKPLRGSSGGDGEHADHGTYKALVKKGMSPAAAAKMCAKADNKVKASALCEAAIVALAGLDAAPAGWVARTALDPWPAVQLAGNAPGNGKLPYGSGEDYADPGYQDDHQKRYPLTKGGKLSAERIRAAWSYINHEKNAAEYSSEQLARIKGRIKAAARKAGVQISDDSDQAAASALLDYASVVSLSALSAAERKKPSAHTIPGSDDFPIPDKHHLSLAIGRYHAGHLAGHSREEVAAHIRSRAKALGVQVDLTSPLDDAVALAASSMHETPATSHPPFHGVHTHAHVHSGDNMHGGSPMRPGW